MCCRPDAVNARGRGGAPAVRPPHARRGKRLTVSGYALKPEAEETPSMPNKDPPVWVLADDRPGNAAQCLGVAEALGLPFVIKDVRYTPAGGLPNLLRGRSLWGVTQGTRAALAPPWPRVVVGAGRRTAPVGRWLKRRSNCVLVQLMDPGPPGRADFDLIAVAHHDLRAPDAANVLRFTGAPHRVTPTRLAAAAREWAGRLNHLPQPRIAVIVGGGSKRRGFTAAHAPALTSQVAAMVEQTGASLMVTTSRRTGRLAEDVLLRALPEPKAVFRWGDAGDNPYLGFLALADAIVVTGDSVSMLCEACGGTAPVYLFSPPGMVGFKHARLHAELRANGYVRPLDAAFEAWRHPPLNAAQLIAGRILRLLAQREAS